MSPENWKAINGFIGLYQISNRGRVRSLNRRVYHPGTKSLHFFRGRLIKPRVNNCGYLQVKLSKDGKSHTKSVHRLIGEAFIPNPLNKGFINHKDGVKGNNSIENLEWVSHAENMKHAYLLRLIKLPTRANIRPITSNKNENAINN